MLKINITASLQLLLLLLSSSSSLLLLPTRGPSPSFLLPLPRGVPTRLLSSRGLGSQELLFLPRPYTTTWGTPGASRVPDPERATVHAVCVEVELSGEEFEGWMGRAAEANPLMRAEVKSEGREEKTMR